MKLRFCLFSFYHRFSTSVVSFEVLRAASYQQVLLCRFYFAGSTLQVLPCCLLPVAAYKQPVSVDKLLKPCFQIIHRFSRFVADFFESWKSGFQLFFEIDNKVRSADQLCRLADR